MTSPYDPRSIANLMLDEADRTGLALTNLALQKLLYFAHAIFLIDQKRPLVSGYFEAWEYGPVHPAAYQAFKEAADQPITFRAMRQDFVSGGALPIPPPNDEGAHRHVERIMNVYGRLTPGRLVDISHAKGAPWDYIVNKGRTSVALGLRIIDDVILERFKHHKVMVRDRPISGEPLEDTPFA